LGVRAPGFFEIGNIRDMAVTNAPALIVAIGMTLVIIAGEIDVSVGSQFAVASVIAGVLAKSGLPLIATAGLTALAGAFFGSVNGTLVTWLGVPSIVATLAAMAFWRELLRWITQGAWVQGLPATFQWMGMSQAGGEFAILASAVVLFGVFVWSMRKVQAGRAVYAVGSQRESARLAGIPVTWISFGVFTLMGALTAVAALLDAVRFSQVQSSAGAGLELKAISAVVIGGASITGGKGSLWGTLLGASVLAVIAPALTFLGINAFWEKAIQGAIILGAIVLERAATRRVQ
jgi:rhamnose transport system permease protein